MYFILYSNFLKMQVFGNKKSDLKYVLNLRPPGVTLSKFFRRNYEQNNNIKN